MTHAFEIELPRDFFAQDGQAGCPTKALHYIERKNRFDVVNCGTERFSMPNFAAANYSTIIKPMPHAHSCPYQKNYHPMVAGHHMMERFIRDFSYIRKRYKPPGLDDSVDCPSTLSVFEERLHDVV